MRLIPVTLRRRLSAAIMLVAAAVAITLSLLVHREFAVTQADQARKLQDERVRILLADWAATGRKVFGAQLDDPRLPTALRAAISGGNRATYLDTSAPTPYIWAAAEIAGHALSVRSPYLEQEQALADLDRVLAIGSAVVIAAGSVLGVVMGAGMSKRLTTAAQAARRVADGEPIRVRDAIGERPRDEAAELAQAVDAMADALQGRLAAEQRVTADIAHELRTPLTGLVTAAELLPPGRPSELVRNRVAALRRLVEDVLEVARLDTDTERAESTDIVLGEFVRRWANVVRVRVVRDACVHTDRRRLERVMVNLLSNAGRHGAQPISVEVDGPCIRVRDHGPGFPAVLLREGPARFRTGGTQRRGGHGLGLTIAVAQARVLDAVVDFANPESGGALVTVQFNS